MSNYDYTEGDGKDVLDKTTPEDNAQVTPELSLSIQQIKKYLLDEVNGLSSTLALDYLPVGTILMFTQSVSDPDWLPCDGRDYSDTEYAELYGVLGYKYGQEQTRFRVPNLNQTLPMGTDGTDLGGRVGTHTVTLEDRHLARHNHSTRRTLGDLRASDTNSYFHRINDSSYVNTENVGESAPVSLHQPSLQFLFYIKAK